MNLISPQLQTFMSVVETKTVHAAAAALNLTQTAVTQRIRTLETQLKTTLFIRSRRGMELTREGEALLRYCQTVKILEGETIAQISGAGQLTEVEVRIEGPTSLMRSRVIPQSTTIIKKFPNLILHFIFNDTDNISQHLKAGACDLAIVTAVDIAQEMTTKKLHSERYKLVCSKKWKDYSLETILQQQRIIDFNPSDQMTLNYLQHFNLLSYIQHARHFVNNIDSMAELVCAGAGYTTLTEEFTNKYIQEGKLMFLNDENVYEYHPVLAWYPRTEMPKYFSEIISQIN